MVVIVGRSPPLVLILHEPVTRPMQGPRFSVLQRKADPLQSKRAGGCAAVCRDLERNLTSYLPESGLVRRGRKAEIAIREIGIDGGIVCAVEDIKYVKPDLEIDSFGNSVVFVEVDIGFVEVRPTERVCLLVPLQTESRNSKVG